MVFGPLRYACRSTSLALCAPDYCPLGRWLLDCSLNVKRELAHGTVNPALSQSNRSVVFIYEKMSKISAAPRSNNEIEQGDSKPSYCAPKGPRTPKATPLTQARAARPRAAPAKEMCEPQARLEHSSRSTFNATQKEPRIPTVRPGAPEAICATPQSQPNQSLPSPTRSKHLKPHIRRETSASSDNCMLNQFCSENQLKLIIEYTSGHISKKDYAARVERLNNEAYGQAAIESLRHSRGAFYSSGQLRFAVSDTSSLSKEEYAASVEQLDNEALDLAVQESGRTTKVVPIGEGIIGSAQEPSFTTPLSVPSITPRNLSKEHHQGSPRIFTPASASTNALNNSNIELHLLEFNNTLFKGINEQITPPP